MTGMDVADLVANRILLFFLLLLQIKSLLECTYKLSALVLHGVTVWSDRMDSQNPSFRHKVARQAPWLHLDSSVDFFSEISEHKHRFSVDFHAEC